MINKRAFVFCSTCLLHASLKWDFTEGLLLSITAMKVTACFLHLRWQRDEEWRHKVSQLVSVAIFAIFPIFEWWFHKLIIKMISTKQKARSTVDTIFWFWISNPRELLSPLLLKTSFLDIHRVSLKLRKLRCQDGIFLVVWQWSMWYETQIMCQESMIGFISNRWWISCLSSWLDSISRLLHVFIVDIVSSGSESMSVGSVLPGTSFSSKKAVELLFCSYFIILI